MPELDFMIVADYVRAEGGLLHMIAAGIDTIYTPAVPAARPVGIGIRLTLTLDEVRQQHQIEVVYQTEDGARLAQISGTVAPLAYEPIGLPGVRLGIAIPLNMSLPLPDYGRYSLGLLVDGSNLKTIGITVTEPPADQRGHA
jgi:hypothetical protein